MTAKLKGYVKDAGRDESDLAIEGRINIAEGSPDDWAGELEEWQALGATHVGVSTGPSSDWNDHSELLSRFRALV